MEGSLSGANSWYFGRFKIVSVSTVHTEDRCAKPAGQVGLPGSRPGTGSFCKLPGWCGPSRFVYENQGFQLDEARLRNCSSLNAPKQTSECKGKGTCGDGRYWLAALVISSVCACDRGGLQLGTAFARKPSTERHGCRHHAVLFRRPCNGTTPPAPMQQGC